MFSRSSEHSQHIRAHEQPIATQQWRLTAMLSTQPLFLTFKRVWVIKRLPLTASGQQNAASQIKQHSGLGVSNPQQGHTPAQQTWWWSMDTRIYFNIHISHQWVSIIFSSGPRPYSLGRNNITDKHMEHCRWIRKYHFWIPPLNASQ